MRVKLKSIFQLQDSHCKTNIADKEYIFTLWDRICFPSTVNIPIYTNIPIYPFWANFKEYRARKTPAHKRKAKQI